MDNIIQTDGLSAMQIDSVRNGRIATNEITTLEGQPVADVIRPRYCEDVEVMVPAACH